MCCYGTEALDNAILTVRSSIDVLARIPGVLLQPLLHAVTVVLVLLALSYGFAWVLSTGRVTPTLDTSLGVTESGALLAGIKRSFEFTQMQWFCLIYWAFGTLWILETIGALAQFAISHAVVSLTCFAGGAEGRSMHPVFQGYLTGLLFHIGTLAFGGFLVGCLKVIGASLWFVSREVGSNASRSERALAAVVSCCCCCCSYCTLCAERLLSMVNDMVYTDVALRGTDFLRGVSNVVEVASENPATYASVKGFALSIRVLGVSIIGGGGSLLSYYVLTATSSHHQLRSIFEGAQKSLAASSILGAELAAAVICFYVALAFMVVFYEATNALLYCKLAGAAASTEAATISARGPKLTYP
jgi:hypothetical protein